MKTIAVPDSVRVHAALCPLHAEARVSSPQVSQAARGHVLAVLERQGDEWHRVRGEDGYEGWAHRGYLGDGSDTRWLPRRTSLGCTVRLATGDTLRLPLGARVGGAEQVLVGEATDEAEHALRFPRAASAVVATAERHFAGTSYQWGGSTPWGADCSGLTQAVFALHGIALPRDAWQQAEAAAGGWATVAEGLGGLASGDLLYFSDRDDGRITHVGLASGPRRMMHLALGRGGWRHERLDDAADPYVAKLRERFVLARRLPW